MVLPYKKRYSLLMNFMRFKIKIKLIFILFSVYATVYSDI